MDALDYLREKRNAYLDFYRRALWSHRDAGKTCTPEVWIQPNPAPGVHDRPDPFCADILARDDDDRPTLSMVTTRAEIPEGARIGMVRAGHLDVPVYPIEWETCVVWSRFGAGAPDWAGLDAWRDHWLDVDERATPDADGFRGRAHFLGPPVAEGGGYLRELDFGSAPVDALVDLLDALIAMGATELEVGRSDGSDLPPAIVAELRRPDLTPSRLAQLFARLVATLDEVEHVEIETEDVVTIVTRRRGGKQQVNLANLYRLLLRIPPEARSKELWRSVRGQREGFQDHDAPDLAQLRPLIKDDRFFDDLHRHAPGMKPIVARRLVADLWVCCVWDSPNGMRYVTEDEAGQYGLTPDQVYDRAFANYLAQPPVVEWSADRDLLVARTGDCYDASLLLNPTFWSDQAAPKVKGDLLACVPARDIVLITGAGSPAAPRMLRHAATKVTAGRDHLVSETILRRTGGAWELYWREGQPEPGSVPPPLTSRRPSPEPTGRPWWKFWA